MNGVMDGCNTGEFQSRSGICTSTKVHEDTYPRCGSKTGLRLAGQLEVPDNSQGKEPSKQRRKAGLRLTKAPNFSGRVQLEWRQRKLGGRAGGALPLDTT